MRTVRANSQPLKLGFLLALLLASACSSSQSGANDAGANSLLAGEVSCTDDPRVDHYEAGLSKQGKLGVLSFTLAESDPAPPAKDENTFVLAISDADGAPADVALAVNLTMPDHGHGTVVVPKISFDADGNSFTIERLDLFMPGVWRIDFTANAQDTEKAKVVDRTSFFFCIEG